MSLPKIHPVILCGGSGKRLWPASRKSMPKQFVRFGDDVSLLQQTIRRLEDISCAPPVLLTAHDYRFVVADQTAELGLRGHKLVVEPEPRNTGPAVCAAAELIHAQDHDALVLICPADHLITDVMTFAKAVAAAIPSAARGEIVTFGIRPDRAETGFGYIELASAHAADGLPHPFTRFVEKPDAATAAAMLDSGRYVWNAGIFLASAKTLIAAFGRHAGSLRAIVRRSIREAKTDLDFLRLGPCYGEAPDLSVDYAVMEHEKGTVVPVSIGWNDLGSWRAVWETAKRDAAGVATSGQALAMDCQDTLLTARDDGIQVVGIGLRNIAAIATRDAVLIADLDSTQSVGEAVKELKLRKAAQAEGFRKEFRPWGHYETLALGPRYQVKSIVVKPGGELSLQSHMHRSEHWVVVEGTARVTIGATVSNVAENQSVYIDLGQVHRLANPGKVDLRLIEVQTGAYLGEDDIIRYEDIYARA
ncbi:mannose-1-phosphate guanylyltransferase/mannose-6-phosphate isomerase [Tabrizicola aquatica]|uniref:mannose-1-phosphate guanylyltransferase/mannose-6-phosphate isomerase n=1 Tax=Tabrizicola aquatica TaxID=909926 RepID=UPI000CD203E5|nr:mannose-1-phosphate guanylyltransferase/mannose-6-phosphate isomerase [Tabrizicola aquatica]